MSLKKYLLIVLLVLLVLLLRIKTMSQPSDPDCISFYNNKGEIILIGIVAEPPKRVGKWQKIKIENLKKPDGLEKETRRVGILRGKIFVKTRLYPKFNYGDILELTGELKTPPTFSDFSYKEYLEIEGVYSLMDFPKIEKQELRYGKWDELKILFLTKVYSLRNRLEQTINTLLPEPHVSLLVGILFGIERNFDENFYQVMQKAGVLHIIVASGYNIMIVSSFFLGFAPIFGRKKNLIFAVFGVLVYAVIAGLQPPIVRAAIMGGGAILAEAFGRRKDALLWLVFAALIMFFVNPLLYKSVSFQLSFAAALAILLFEPRLEKFFYKVPVFLRESLTTTLAVQLLTFPIVYFNFHKVSLFSLPVNILVLETIPIIMGLGAAATFAGLASISLGKILAFPAWVLLEYFVKVIEIFT